jgi:hypothetical protein
VFYIQTDAAINQVGVGERGFSRRTKMEWGGGEGWGSWGTGGLGGEACH